MVIRSYQPILQIVGKLRFHLLAITVYAVAVSALDVQYHLENYNFPVAIVVATATVIGLLLAFRTNAAYERWWEARIIWGAIVNDSRTWVRQLIEFSSSNESENRVDSELRQLAYRQIAWCFSLSRSLRGSQPTRDITDFVDPDELETYRQSKNVPNAILLVQGRELKQWYANQRLELFMFVELEKTLTRLTDSMGEMRTHQEYGVSNVL